jgi:hypothetical protein
MTNVSNEEKRYDFIVVGAGPGDVLPGLGCILERIRGRDVWSHGPFFQQLRDFAEHLP